MQSTNKRTAAVARQMTGASIEKRVDVEPGVLRGGVTGEVGAEALDEVDQGALVDHRAAVDVDQGSSWRHQTELASADHRAIYCTDAIGLSEIETRSVGRHAAAEQVGRAGRGILSALPRQLVEGMGIEVSTTLGGLG
ncbi:MAG TPA: hypothetical protein VGR22_03975 [Thermomicrobiales bacterium]|nr:hypothetical protein [Thermomicrobiales bacterium]